MSGSFKNEAGKERNKNKFHVNDIKKWLNQVRR
jgi:hypothetical protein